MFSTRMQRASGRSDVRVHIRGYADRRGDDSYNEILSRKRAERVASYLSELGLAPGAIEVAWFGEDPQDSVPLWKMRRVDVELAPFEEDVP